MIENTKPLTHFPDGTPVDSWFHDVTVPTLDMLGKQYPFDQYGILDDGTLQTEKIQALIDLAASEGGGCLVVTRGTFLTGSIFFKQGVNLYVSEGGMLKGSNSILDYPLCETRIEGEKCLFFPGMINADGLDGFVMCGPGTIDGNGMNFWRQFWLRRAWNPKCTNKDEQRPRLVFISNCKNVTLAGLTFQNSAFWTTHIYKCQFVKYIGCSMYSPHAPIGGPSTDAIDVDACTDVLIKNCYMEVNDDAVALKGGKGPWADTAPENGANERIVIEDCEYGFCHGCLTFGSESIHNRNIVFRNVKVSTGYNMLWIKLRPDTPQLYEYILMENISGKAANFLNINPWSQFFDLKGRTDLPLSHCNHLTIRNCDGICDHFFNVKSDEEHYHLADFTFENLNVTATNGTLDQSMVENFQVSNVTITPKDTIDFPDSVTTMTDDNSIIHLDK